MSSMAGMKRKREDWTDVGSDVVECVMRRSCFVDILRMKSACSWWFSVAESYTSSPSYFPCFQTPWLLLPNPNPKEEEEGEEDKKGKSSSESLCFFNLDEKKAYRDVCLCREVYEGRCVGSSHGWLFLLDKTANLSLFNPFSGARIQVDASLRKGDHGSEEESFDVDEYTPDYDGAKYYKGGRAFISQAVLMMMSDDMGKKKRNRINKEKDGIVLIYQGRNKLAFCMLKNGSRFMDLDGSHELYNDVICYDNLVCAISNDGFVEVWDFSTAGSGSFSPTPNTPTKIMDIRSFLPLKKGSEFQRSSRLGCCLYHYHLVESCAGELLSVVRIVGIFLDGKDSQPTITKEMDMKMMKEKRKRKKISNFYKTLMFYVFKLDLHHLELVEIESLGDQVLFLGGNHSISLRAEDCPGCVKDSIYFTDSYWEYVDEDESYGGHDMGYFNLKDRCVKPFYEATCQQHQQQQHDKMKPIPFWILPNP